MSREQDAWVLDTFGIDVSAAIGGDQDSAREPGEIGGFWDWFSGKKKSATATAPSKPVPRAALGTAQTERSDKLLKAMSPGDQTKIETLLTKAKPDEKSYLTKALASGHTATELETFFAAIKGKDAKWMQDNLHVVGDSKGRGVKQQWSMSCAPTSVQAVKAEMDPIYALKLRTDSPKLDDADDTDGTAKNPKLAKEQSDMMQTKGVTAVARDTKGGGLSVQGVEDIFNDTKSSTGVDFKTNKIADATIDTELDDMGASITGGLPVPLLVGAAGKPGHAVVLIGYDKGPPRRFTIHDPGNGKTADVTEKQIKDKTLNISGWTEITHFLKPGAV